MNVIWTVVVVISLAVLTVTNPNQVVALCVKSASQAVDYAVQLVAVYSLWLGVFSVAEKCFLVQKLAQILTKFNGFLYGKVSQVANEYLSLNMASNILGVGNAATPSAICAIKNMESGSTLSRAGAMLFVLNANGIQLVPTTVIGLRATMGSQNPSSILVPTAVCAVVTAILGVILVCIAYPKRRAI